MSTPQNDAASPGQVILHYQVEERLGAGGMGVVFKALDLRLKRHVALKFLGTDLHKDPSFNERLLREAMAASALDHPNIGAVHALEDAGDGRIFIVMGFYPGGTLKDRLEKGWLGNAEAADIAIQAARGLAEAHSRSIMHRDIKPSNLILTPEGVVKIVDFGLAKFTGGTDLTQTGAAVGTAAYMSPEQATCAPIDYRTDIWSLGVVLYQMVRGEMPFQADTVLALMYQVVHTEPRPLPGKPPALQRVISKCLAKDPRERYASAEELAADLERFRNSLAAGGSAETVVMPPPVPEVPIPVSFALATPKRPSRLPFVVAAIFLSVAGSAWLWVTLREPPTVVTPVVTGPKGSGSVTGDPQLAEKVATIPDPLTVATPPPQDPKLTKSTARGPVASVYTGPKEGRIVWTGDVDAGQEIDLSAKSTMGTVTGALPGVPVTIEVHPPSVRVATPPGPSNQWRSLVLHNDGKKQVVIVINWTVNSR